MRELTTHHADRFGKQLKVACLDQSKAAYGLWGEGVQGLVLRFQQGDPAEVGVNGFSEEALLAVLADKYADDPEVLVHVGAALAVVKGRAEVLERGRAALEEADARREEGRSRAEEEAAQVEAREGAARAEAEARVAEESERLRLEDEEARRVEEESLRERDRERKV